MKPSKALCGFVLCVAFGGLALAEEDVATPERVLAESFPDLFEPLTTVTPYFWTADFNQDGSEDVAVLGKSKKAVSDAWARLPIHNPPYELASRGEVLENPLFEPHYSIHENENYLIVFHSGTKGWKNFSVATAFILQDVSDAPVELTSFGESAQQVPAFKVRYEDKPGLVYWDYERYILALKE